MYSAEQSHCWFVVAPAGVSLLQLSQASSSSWHGDGAWIATFWQNVTIWLNAMGVGGLTVASKYTQPEA